MSASPKHELSESERQAIIGLRQVRFPVASWDKRFYRDVLCHALESGMIGEKSAPQLWRLFIRYRRQIDLPEKAHLLAKAEMLSAPDFRKQQAAAEVDEIKAKYQAAMHGLKRATNVQQQKR